MAKIQEPLPQMLKVLETPGKVGKDVLCQHLGQMWNLCVSLGVSWNIFGYFGPHDKTGGPFWPAGPI